MEFTVDDDSGFLGIIDPDAYEGFVAEDWTYESLFAHFAAQTARRALLLWATSADGGSWTVALEGTLAGARSATGPITSRQGRLCLVNYETLTMAAQFADVTLPEPHLADLELEVVPGAYACTVTQVHDDDSHPAPHFGLYLAPSDGALTPWASPAWYDPASGTFTPLG
jgi:hypothetical protein